MRRPGQRLLRRIIVHILFGDIPAYGLQVLFDLTMSRRITKVASPSEAYRSCPPRGGSRRSSSHRICRSRPPLKASFAFDTSFRFNV